MLHFKKTYMD